MALNVAIIDGMSSATAGDLVHLTNSMLSQEGVVVGDGTELSVSQADTPALTIEVKAGTCYVLNDGFTVNNGEVKHWHVTLTADTEASIDSNSSGSTRIDAVCIEVDTAVTPDATASNVATITVVKGTPGGGNPVIPNNHLLLAYVSVEDGETTILDADITDSRQYFGIALPHTSGARLRDTSGSLDAKFYEDTTGDIYLLGTKSGGGFRVRQSNNLFQFRNSHADAWNSPAPTKTTITSSATPTPTGDNLRNLLHINALAAAAEFQAPSGTPADGNVLIIRVEDNGTGRALTYNALYRAVGITLPTTTTANKTTYIGAVYNSFDAKWDCLATNTET